MAESVSDPSNRESLNAISENETEIIIYNSSEPKVEKMYKRSKFTRPLTVSKSKDEKPHAVGKITASEVPRWYQKMEDVISYFRFKYENEFIQSICDTIEYLLDKRIIDDDEKVEFWSRLLGEAVIDMKYKDWIEWISKNLTN